MALKKITYNGSSKVIINLCKMVNQLIDGAGSPSASDVSYDNTGSGLSAENVQDAIDEVHGDIPTKTSDLTNDSGFITNAVNNLANYYLKSETYTQAEVDALISAISTMHFEVVASLPVSDIQTNVIYLVPSSDPEAQNIYDEYINTTGTSAGWELIGSTQVDLSDYVTTSDLATALSDYVTNTDLTTILANYVKSADLGDGILTIQQDGVTVGTFSANQSGNSTVNLTGGGSTYTEGDGIDISAQNEISVDTTFTEASTRTNIASGESFATILGKIKKWFSDLASMFVRKTGDTMSGNLAVDKQDGTTSAIGYSYINIGNNIPQGTDGNSAGVLGIYGNGSTRGKINAFNVTGNRDYALPDKNGTIALTSDIPNIPTDFVSKANGGTFNGNVAVNRADGTAGGSESWSLLTLGNATGRAVAKHSNGRLRLYRSASASAATAYYTEVRPGANTANRTITFPNATGTVALTSDIANLVILETATLATKFGLELKVFRRGYVYMLELIGTLTQSLTANTQYTFCPYSAISDSAASLNNYVALAEFNTNRLVKYYFDTSNVYIAVPAAMSSGASFHAIGTFVSPI